MKFDYVFLLIIWMLQASVLGIAAAFFKNRALVAWVVIGLLLPGVAYVALCFTRRLARDTQLFEVNMYTTIPLRDAELGKRGWK